VLSIDGKASRGGAVRHAATVWQQSSEKSNRYWTSAPKLLRTCLCTHPQPRPKSCRPVRGHACCLPAHQSASSAWTGARGAWQAKHRCDQHCCLGGHCHCSRSNKHISPHSQPKQVLRLLPATPAAAGGPWQPPGSAAAAAGRSLGGGSILRSRPGPGVARPVGAQLLAHLQQQHTPAAGQPCRLSSRHRPPPRSVRDDCSAQPRHLGLCALPLAKTLRPGPSPQHRHETPPERRRPPCCAGRA